MMLYKRRRKYYLSENGVRHRIPREAVMALSGWSGMEGVERFGISFPQMDPKDLTEEDLQWGREMLAEFDEIPVPSYVRLLDALENEPPENLTDRALEVLMEDDGFYSSQFPEQYKAAEAEYARRKSA